MARILHVVGDSGFGGGAQVILAVAGGARAAGHEVDVLTTDRSFASAARKAGLGVVDLDVIRRPIRPWADLRGAWGLARYLRRNRYDLVHTHTSKAGVVGRWAADRVGVPVVVHTVHGFAFHEETHPAVIWGVSLIERWAARRSDAIVTVSEFHRDWALRLGVAPSPAVRAIANGIDPRRVTATRDRTAVRAELGVHDGTTTLVVSQGRVVGGKGLEALVEAAGRLAADGLDLVVAIVGEGGLRAQLEERAAQGPASATFRFTGFRSDIGDLLDAADLVVLPSRREGMSIALLEGMASGRAVIASSVTSAPEVTLDGAVACLVRPEHVEDLVGAITVLARDADERARLGRAGALRFQAAYTEHRMVEKYMDLYRERGLAFDGQVPAASMVVRPLVARNARACARLHHQGFREFFLTTLGPRFLGRFYADLLTTEGVVGHGAFVGDHLVAFAVGAERSGGLYRGLVRRDALGLTLAALPALVADPRRAWHLARSLNLQSDNTDGQEPVLLSICTDPSRRGQGAGRAVLAAFEADLAVRRPAAAISLLTDRDDNEVVRSFYASHGYRLVGEVVQGTRTLVRLARPPSEVSRGASS